MEKLHSIFSNDMVMAVAYLTQAVNTLQAYAGSGPPSLESGTVESGGTPASETAQEPVEPPIDPTPNTL